MIFENFELLPKQNYQVVIFGSGPAGLTLALELEKKKISSLIIEAGEKSYSDTSQDNYKSKIFGDVITDLRDSRLRQLGGTSGHWGGWCKPMEIWNLKKWKLRPEDISKYSVKTCEILDIPLNFKKTKINNYFNQIQFQYSDVRFAEKYENHLRKSKLINLCLNTQVINFKGKNGIFQKAEIISNNIKNSIEAKFFVLACGGVENSRILLWVKENNKSLINPNLPIGKYWMTHPWILGGIGFIKKNKFKNFLKENYINYEGPIHIASSENLVNQKKILSGALYMTADEDQKIHKEIIKNFLCISPENGKKIARMLFNKDLKCGNIFMNLEEVANKENKILLDTTETDKNGIPITNLYYKKSEETLLSAKTILEEIGKLFAKEDLGRIAIKDEIENLKDYENLGANHHMGGTRIGDNIKESVVDRNLKLHEIKNVYLAGSSVFKTSGYANPTYTIVQLSLRLADELDKKIKML